MPYTVEIANRGWRDALRADHPLALGLNTHACLVTCEPVAEAHGLPYTPIAEVLNEAVGQTVAEAVRGYLQYLVVERGWPPIPSSRTAGICGDMRQRLPGGGRNGWPTSRPPTSRSSSRRCGTGTTSTRGWRSVRRHGR